jgi:hypothetical protein
VKELNFTENACEAGSPEAWIELSRTRPVSPFPRLSKIHWRCIFEEEDLDRSTLFMSERVTELLVTPSSLIDDIGPYCQQLPTLSPNITHLSFGPKDPIECVVEPLVDMLLRLPKLRDVRLTTFYFVPEILNALSTLPHLQNWFPWNIYPHDELHPFVDFAYVCRKNFAFPPKAFQSLVWLYVHTSLDAMVELLKVGFTIDPPPLERITISAAYVEPVEDFKRFYQTVARLCPSLIGLEHLTEYADVTSPTHRSTPVRPFEVIRPLFHLRKLKSFDFNGVCMLDINEKDLTDLLIAWPELEELNICTAMPITALPPPKPKLSMEVFRILHKYAPQIKMVWLYLDATGDWDFVSFRQCRLPQLLRFSVGHSPIDNPWLVGMALSYILPTQERRLNYGTHHYWGNGQPTTFMTYAPPEVLEYLKENCERWDECFNRHLESVMKYDQITERLGISI